MAVKPAAAKVTPCCVTGDKSFFASTERQNPISRPQYMPDKGRRKRKKAGLIILIPALLFIRINPVSINVATSVPEVMAAVRPAEKPYCCWTLALKNSCEPVAHVPRMRLAETALNGLFITPANKEKTVSCLFAMFMAYRTGLVAKTARLVCVKVSETSLSNEEL